MLAIVVRVAAPRHAIRAPCERHRTQPRVPERGLDLVGAGVVDSIAKANLNESYFCDCNQGWSIELAPESTDFVLPFPFHPEHTYVGTEAFEIEFFHRQEIWTERTPSFNVNCQP